MKRKASRSRLRRQRGRRTRRSRARSQKGGNSAPVVDLVIARYKEPLIWLPEVLAARPFRRVYIYNKGPKMECPSMPPGVECKLIDLENVGVCDHTYLYHIIHEYDSFPDFTVFCPGSAELGNKDYKLKMVLEKVFDKREPLFIGYVCDNDVSVDNATFALDEWKTSAKDNQTEGESIRLAPAWPRPFGDWYRHWLPGVPSRLLSFTGIFAVSGEILRQHPPEHYQKFLDQLSHDKFPEAAHYVERVWPAILHPYPEKYFYFER